MNVKKGDVVGRISYDKDLMFSVKKILNLNNGERIAILSGVTARIEADSPLEDLELIDKAEVKKKIKSFEDEIIERIKKC